MTAPISSTANARIKALVRLRQRRERDTTGRFIVEGFRELTRAVAAGLVIETLYTCPSLYLGGNEPALAATAVAAGAELVEVDETPFRRASYRDRPEGLLAVAIAFDTGLTRIPLPPDALLLVAESIEKPGNLGTMLRTAEAAGAHGVIVADPTTDPFNPNVVRASLGTVFTVPLAIAESAATIAHLRSAGVAILAATPAGDTPHYSTDMRRPVAIVIGAEQYGLTAVWLEAADTRVFIPMPGSVDSLNAAMAAGILLFEARRQRARHES